MTAKRFTITQDFEEHHRQIRDNGHIIMGCFVEPQAEVIVDLLNELHEEKEQLQSRINDYDVALKTLQGLTDRKLKENEQLKKELDQFYLLIGRGDWSGLVDLIKGDVE